MIIMMKKIFSVTLLIAGITFGFAQKQVIPLSQKNNASMSLPSFEYILPITAFEVQVCVVKTKDMTGYYSDYAEKLLGLTSIITTDKTSYKIEEVKIRALTLPDPNHQYVVELSPAQVKQSYLSKIMDSESIAFETATSTPYYVKSTPIPDFYRNYADLAYTETDDSFLETKIINGVVTQIPVNKTKKISKTLDQQAQEAADLISNIRQARFDLLTGVQEVAYPQGTIQFMVEQLNQYENNYLGLFTGFSVSEELNYTFVVTPDKKGKSAVFSFDGENGIDEPLSIKSDNIFYLKITPSADKTGTITMKEEFDSPIKTKPEGYRFRKAMPAKISLMENDNEIHFFGHYMLYQLGELICLPIGNDQFDIGKFGVIN